MKTINQSLRGIIPTLKKPWGWRAKFLSIFCAALGLLTSSRAALPTLYWDAGNTNDGALIEAGSGAWDTDTTTNFNWNNGTANVSWTQSSTTLPLNNAVFGGTDAALGTYQVVLDGTQICPGNMYFNANGYELSGATLYDLGGVTNAWLVADGKTVIISNNVTGPGATFSFQGGDNGAPATLVFLGNISGGNPYDFLSTNNSIFYIGGAANTPSQTTVNGNVWFTNGLWTENATFEIGRSRGGVTQPNNVSGSFTMDGPSTTMNLSTQIQMCRGGNSVESMTVQNGATLNLIGNGNHLQIESDSQNNSQSTFYMKNGTFTAGSSSTPDNVLLFRSGGSAPNRAVYTQSGGVATIWGGIVIGSGSTAVLGTSAITNTGGFLYIGSGGIAYAVDAPATNYFVISGGTIGALASWSSSLPMYLDVVNGNITFQTADSGGVSWNILLSGALTGPGGLYKTGSGTLTLSGANNYAGSTVVSNGTLTIIPTQSPVSGSLTLDGSVGTPTVSMSIGNPGQFWTINGNLAYNNIVMGTPTEDFNFGNLPPSTSVAPMQVTNNVAFTAMPNVTIEGTGIYAATYPLIKYGGTVTGTLPTPSLPSGVSGYLSNSVANHIIYLVVTSSTVSASYVWSKPQGGSWDFSTANWKVGGGPLTDYVDNFPAQFDDSAAASGPVIVTNNSAVHPGALTVLGTNTWTILGNGSIGDGTTPTTVTKSGSGTLVLWGTNNYSGGTTVKGGQLNINFGGDGNNDSAIGTGPLILDLGAKLDNTSGQAVTLAQSISQTWEDDWTFVGTTNFNTGSGPVTLGSAVITLNVVSNTLAIGGGITDGGVGNSSKIQKIGNGALSLLADGSFVGGLEVDAGIINFGSGNCAGSGVLTISGGLMDNVSGSDLTLGGISSITVGSTNITYLGTSNSLNMGSVQVNPVGNMGWTVISNKLEFDGVIASGNGAETKYGRGTLVFGGSGANGWVGDVYQGELDLARISGAALGTGGSSHIGIGGAGVSVHSNAVVRVLSATQQFPTGNYNNVIADTGGVIDFNGNNQNIDMMIITNGGIMQNSAIGTLCQVSVPGNLNNHPTNAITLGSTNCFFDVPDGGSELDINGIINGPGSLIKTGLGVLSLLQSNYYAGNVTVLGGTLTVAFPDLTNTAIVALATNAAAGNNALLNLNYTGTNVIDELILGGVAVTNGLHNATSDPLYLAGSGSLQIVYTAPVTVNPLPGPIQFTLSSSTLSLSWPTNLGWILQSQTNALSAGLQTKTNAWVDWPATANVTSTNIGIVPTNPAVFFRLRHP